MKKIDKESINQTAVEYQSRLPHKKVTDKQVDFAEDLIKKFKIAKNKYSEREKENKHIKKGSKKRKACFLELLKFDIKNIHPIAIITFRTYLLKWAAGKQLKTLDKDWPIFAKAVGISSDCGSLPIKGVEMITLTKDLIEAGSTNNIGYTNKQLKAIGVSLSDKFNWKNNVIGTQITLTQYEKFLALSTQRQAEALVVGKLNKRPSKRVKQLANRIEREQN